MQQESLRSWVHQPLGNPTNLQTQPQLAEVGCNSTLFGQAFAHQCSSVLLRRQIRSSIPACRLDSPRSFGLERTVFQATQRIYKLTLSLKKQVAILRCSARPSPVSACQSSFGGSSDPRSQHTAWIVQDPSPLNAQ